DERLAEEFAHFPIDLTGPEIAVVQENLQTGRCFLVVVRQGYGIDSRRRGCALLCQRKDRCRAKCDDEKNEYHRRKLSAVNSYHANRCQLLSARPVLMIQRPHRGMARTVSLKLPLQP